MDSAEADPDRETWSKDAYHEVGVLLRRLVDEVCSDIDIDPESSSRFVIAAHELFENAIRFGADGCIRLKIRIEDADVVIETENRASLADVARVTELIEQMERYDQKQPRLWFHVERLRESTRYPEGLGLGLSRVFAESGMNLSCLITEGAIVITARARLKGKGESTP